MFLFYITLKIYFLHSSSLLCCLSFKLYPLGLRMPLCTAWIKLNCIHWEFHNPSPSVLLSEMCGKLASERKWNLCIKSAAMHATQSIRAPLYLFQMNAQATGKLLAYYKRQSVSRIHFLQKYESCFEELTAIKEWNVLLNLPYSNF